MLATVRELQADLKWAGIRAHHKTGLRLPDLSEMLPVFERKPFGSNEYLDTVVRKPFGLDDRFMPVAAVSKRYALIQHREVVDWMMNAFYRVGVKAEDVPAELWMTEYGERARFRLRVPKAEFDPGDGYPIVLSAECFNSVDKSCALEIRMAWVRLVCTNGMTVSEEATLRKVHDMVWMNRTDPGEFMDEQLSRAHEHFALFRAWMEVEIDYYQLVSWANKVIADKWTKESAARLCHISRTGFDGRVSSTNGKPHEWLVSSDIEVPGSNAPIRTAFHAAQALSWIAGRRQNIDEQLKWMRQIPPMTAELIA